MTLSWLTPRRAINAAILLLYLADSLLAGQENAAAVAPPAPKGDETDGA